MRRSAARLYAMLLAALIPAAPALSQAPALSPAPGTYGGAIAVAPPEYGAGPGWLYRFGDEGEWLGFDLPLVLDAAPQEERIYELQARPADGSGADIACRYVIDRRAPPEPVILPADGSLLSSARLQILAETGSAIRYAVAGSMQVPESAWDPAAPPVFHASKDGTTSLLVVAWAVDASGNAGPPAYAAWRLVPDGAPRPGAPAAAATKPATIRTATTDPGVPELVERKSDSVVFRFPAPPAGSAWIYSVNPPEPERSLLGFVVAAADSRPLLELPAPRGWNGPLVVRYGLLSSGIATLASAPLPIPAWKSVTLPDPPDPMVATAPDGSLAISWPAGSGTLLVGVDGGKESVWEGVRVVAPKPGRAELELSFRTVSADGSASAARRIRVAAKPAPRAPIAVGASAGAVLGIGPEIGALGEGVIRYRVSDDGTIPREVETDASVLDGSVKAPGIAGEVVRYSFRFRSFAEGGRASDETFLSFVVDREPPPVPILSGGTAAWLADGGRRVEFKPLDGTVMVAVSSGATASASYSPYGLPIDLRGNAEGPVRYTVRAYAVDAAGNRSAEMAPYSVLIDPSSVYVASWGRDDARGDPDSPLKTLGAGISRAVANGAKSVKVSGDIAFGLPATVRTPLSIAGAYGKDWESGAGRSRVDTGTMTGTALSSEGAELLISRLDFVSASSASFVLLGLRGGSLKLDDSSASIRAAGEATFLRSAGASALIGKVMVEFPAAVAARAVSAVDGAVTLREVRVSASAGVPVFGAVTLAGTSCELESVIVESFATRNFTGISSAGGRLSIRALDLRASGGSGTCSPFDFEQSEATIETSFAGVEWKASFAFVRSQSSGTAIDHATFIASAPGYRVTMFDALGEGSLVARNSILQVTASTGEFLASDRSGLALSFATNCLWGYTSYGRGALALPDLAALNRLPGTPKPNFIETPGTTFSGSVKGRPALSARSACVDGAYATSASSRADLDGDTRSDGAADIGADEFRK